MFQLASSDFHVNHLLALQICELKLKPKSQKELFFINSYELQKVCFSQSFSFSKLENIYFTYINFRQLSKKPSSDCKEIRTHNHLVCKQVLLREKCPNREFFLIRIFPHSD